MSLRSALNWTQYTRRIPRFIERQHWTDLGGRKRDEDNRIIPMRQLTLRPDVPDYEDLVVYCLSRAPIPLMVTPVLPYIIVVLGAALVVTGSDPFVVVPAVLIGVLLTFALDFVLHLVWWAEPDYLVKGRRAGVDTRRHYYAVRRSFIEASRLGASSDDIAGSNEDEEDIIWPFPAIFWKSIGIGHLKVPVNGRKAPLLYRWLCYPDKVYELFKGLATATEEAEQRQATTAEDAFRIELMRDIRQMHREDWTPDEVRRYYRSQGTNVDDYLPNLDMLFQDHTSFQAEASGMDLSMPEEQDSAGTYIEDLEAEEAQADNELLEKTDSVVLALLLKYKLRFAIGALLIVFALAGRFGWENVAVGAVILGVGCAVALALSPYFTRLRKQRQRRGSQDDSDRTKDRIY